MHKRTEVVATKVPLFIPPAIVSQAMPGRRRTQAAAAPPPPPEVRVAPVVQQDVPVYSEWAATLDGSVNAQVRPQVSGCRIKQNYKEGSLVRKGETLFEIDPRLFQAALDRAKGDLAQAQAQLGKSALDVERNTALAEARAIAKGQLDDEIQAGIAQIQCGHLVGSNSILTSVSQLDPNPSAFSGQPTGVRPRTKEQQCDFEHPRHRFFRKLARTDLD